MIRHGFSSLFIFILSVNIACAEDKTRTDTRRGALWESLTAQVNIWQRVSGLTWDKNDINEVSHYLNNTFYHYP